MVIRSCMLQEVLLKERVFQLHLRVVLRNLLDHPDRNIPYGNSHRLQKAEAEFLVSALERR